MCENFKNHNVFGACCQSIQDLDRPHLVFNVFWAWTKEAWTFSLLGLVECKFLHYWHRWNVRLVDCPKCPWLESQWLYYESNHQSEQTVGLSEIQNWLRESWGSVTLFAFIMGPFEQQAQVLTALVIRFAKCSKTIIYVFSICIISRHGSRKTNVFISLWKKKKKHRDISGGLESWEGCP